MYLFVKCFVGLLLITPVILQPSLLGRAPSLHPPKKNGDIDLFLYFDQSIAKTPIIIVSDITKKIRNIPSPLTFLSDLLNTTKEEIPYIVSRFEFHDVPLEDIKFLLYKKPNHKGEISNETTPITANDLDLTKPTKFIVHGWQSAGTADFVSTMATSYYNLTENLNVVAVDWSSHASNIYLIASGATEGVGHHLGDFIVNATKDNENYLKSIHIIGHSLGAHVSGFAGKRVIGKTGKKLPRITGLDAASPLFEFPSCLDESKRISKNDAEFVDGIHTNIYFLGVNQPFGHSDFYVDNGGPIQPGCGSVIIFEAFICSHSKSQEYFSETITNRTYEGSKCPIGEGLSLCRSAVPVLMGEPASPDAKGTYYVLTDSPAPILPTPHIKTPNLHKLPLPKIRLRRRSRCSIFRQ